MAAPRLDDQPIHASRGAGHVHGVVAAVGLRAVTMNNLVSTGLRRAWTIYALMVANAQPGHQVLDLSSGTDGLASSLARRVGPRGLVLRAGASETSLRSARDRDLDAGVVLPTMVCAAAALPLVSDRFDLVTVAFGLHDMARKDLALTEMARVLRPGGRLLVLDFSRAAPALHRAGQSFRRLPLLGRLAVRDGGRHRHPAEARPGPQELKALMQSSGFGHVDYHNLTGGIVALHVGLKCG